MRADYGGGKHGSDETDGHGGRPLRLVVVPQALYIHIPFCRSKCPYCDFTSVAGREDLIEAYVEALLSDLRHARDEVGPVAMHTVYVGGGTPTAVPAERIAEVLAACAGTFPLAADAEVTCECNPGTVDASSLRRLRSAGVNRLSIGVQSFHDRELRFLGRIHSAEEAREAYLAARGAGFANVSLDLISCLPDQTLEDWEASLGEAVALGPDHVSAYCLQVEAGTPLADAVQSGEVVPLDEEAQATLYLRTGEVLEAAGLAQYEISSYARAGHECRHNLVYWRNEPYLGLGAGAWSYVAGSRRQKTADVEEYIASWRSGAPPWAYQETVDGAAAANETLMMALRTREGLHLGAFLARHGRDLLVERGEVVRQLRESSLAWCQAGRLGLTRAGMAVAGEAVALLAFSEED